jgi:hypothetical protein
VKALQNNPSQLEKLVELVQATEKPFDLDGTGVEMDQGQALPSQQKLRGSHRASVRRHEHGFRP